MKIHTKVQKKKKKRETAWIPTFILRDFTDLLAFLLASYWEMSSTYNMKTTYLYQEKSLQFTDISVGIESFTYWTAFFWD